MKKKCLAVLLAGVMAVSVLAGCSKLGSKEISNDNITISKYKGIEVEKVAPEEVTDEDVESELQSTLQANRIINEVTDRAAQNGDTVTIDYVGKMDGEEFQGGSATDTDLTLGSGGFIEGFEAGLVGHANGETVELNLTFPENYSMAPEKAGKPVVFTVTIKKITTQTLPELNDEFVQSVSKDSKTVEEYKKEIKKKLKEQNQENADISLQNAVWNEVIANSEVKKYPKEDVKEETDNLKKMYVQMAEYNGLEFKDFLEQSMNGMTEEQFDEQAEEAAKSTVKQKLAVKLIAEKEKLDLSEKEYDKEIEQYAKDYGFESSDAIKEAIDEDVLKNDILMTKVKKWLAENCKQVDKVEKKDAKDTKDEKTDEGK